MSGVGGKRKVYALSCLPSIIATPKLGSLTSRLLPRAKVQCSFFRLPDSCFHQLGTPKLLGRLIPQGNEDSDPRRQLSKILTTSIKFQGLEQVKGCCLGTFERTYP